MAIEFENLGVGAASPMENRTAFLLGNHITSNAKSWQNNNGG